MDMIRDAIQAVVKRPFILVLVSAVMLAAAVFNVFIPVMAMVVGIIKMTGGGFFDSILSIIQVLIDPSSLVTLLISLAVLALLLSAAAGLLLPGYILIVNDGLNKGRKMEGLFSAGIKNSFLKFFIITLKTTLVTAVFAVFLLISAVPAIIVSKAAFSTKPDLMLPAVFIDIVTVCIFFLCLSFFRIYVSMWYAAAAFNEEKPFKTGKAAGDRRFWSTAMGFLGFDVVFSAVIFLIYQSSSQIFRYGAGWIFASLFFAVLAVFIMRSYRYSFIEKEPEDSDDDL
ncbi:MAG TPA: hypothetical protein VHT96_09690 [Clostridia bacterium]|nr:hypothetical protein [Clostridia bacterium]